jgi:hypothetical protein
VGRPGSRPFADPILVATGSLHFLVAAGSSQVLVAIGSLHYISWWLLVAHRFRLLHGSLHFMVAAGSLHPPP